MKGDVDSEFNLKLWESSYDAINGDPEENSQLDTDKDDSTMVDKFRFDEKSQNFGLKRPIQLSIVGRPNVGKSSLTNAILKENRVVVDNHPGTTRDSIKVSWTYKVIK